MLPDAKRQPPADAVQAVDAPSKKKHKPYSDAAIANCATSKALAILNAFAVMKTLTEHDGEKAVALIKEYGTGYGSRVIDCA